MLGSTVRAVAIEMLCPMVRAVVVMMMICTIGMQSCRMVAAGMPGIAYKSLTDFLVGVMWQKNPSFFLFLTLSVCLSLSVRLSVSLTLSTSVCLKSRTRCRRRRRHQHRKISMDRVLFID